MKCDKYKEDSKLVKFGLMSFSMCYECPSCGHREVYKLGISNETRKDIMNHFNRVPHNDKAEIERVWLDKLDSLVWEY